ncbi:MAG: cupin domain-containing protein [Ilumatobacteraceae bacterium]
MAAGDPVPFSVDDALAALTFMPDRSPTTTDEQAGDAFGRLSDYREGGIFVGHWAGNSEWERHPVGDEIVMVIDGETTIVYLAHDGEHPARLRAGELVVVPQGTWHRFETPVGVKIFSVTPQPTDHSPVRPT